MLPPTSSIARLARAGFVGLSVLVGAVLAHVSQGGVAPPAVAVAPVVMAVTGVAWWSGSRRLHVVPAFVLLAAAQVAVHLLASYVHGHVLLPTTSMLVAHGASLVLVAAGIATAERLWWSLWDCLTGVTRLVVSSAPVPAALALPLPPTGTTRVAADVLAHVVLRRGPPGA